MEKVPIVVITPLGKFVVQANRWFVGNEGAYVSIFEYAESKKSLLTITGPCVIYYRDGGIEASK